MCKLALQAQGHDRSRFAYIAGLVCEGWLVCLPYNRHPEPSLAAFNSSLTSTDFYVNKNIYKELPLH